MADHVQPDAGEEREVSSSGLLLSVDPLQGATDYKLSGGNSDGSDKGGALGDDTSDSDGSDSDALGGDDSSDADGTDKGDDSDAGDDGSDADGTDVADADGTDTGLDADGTDPLGIQPENADAGGASARMPPPDNDGSDK